MFSKKDSHSEKDKNTINKVDALITGVILGWVVASIYGIKKAHDKREELKHTTPQTSLFEEPKKEEKKGLFRKIFRK